MRTHTRIAAATFLLALFTALGIAFAPAQEAALPAPPEGGSFAQLQEGAESLARELDESRKVAAELASEIEVGAARLAAIPGEVAALRADVAQTPVPATPPAAAGAAEVAAHQQVVAARKALSDRIAELEAEADRYQSAADLLVTRQRAASERSRALQSAHELWLKAADAARTREAASASAVVLEKAGELAEVPALAKLAAANLELAERRAEISGSVAAANRHLSEVDARTERFRKERLAAERRVRLLESAGLGIDAETGKLLRAQRAQMKEPRELRATLEARLRESAEAALDKLALESQREAERFGLIEARVAEIVDAAAKPKPSEQQVRELLEERRAIYDALAADLEKRSSALSSANEKSKRAVDEAIAHARFLDERLLWIRSTTPVSGSDLAIESAALQSLAASLADGGALGALVEDLRAQPLPWLVCALTLAYLIVRRGKLRRAVEEAGVAGARRNCQSFVPTGMALGCTVLLALPLPLACGFLGWRAGFGSPLGQMLLAATVFTALFGGARLLTVTGGVVESHFRVGRSRVSLLHRNLNWFLPVGGVAVLLAAALPEVAPPPAGRLLFIVAMVLLMFLLHSILRPRGGVILRRGSPTKFAYFWYWMGIVVPAALAAGAAMGYFESVQALRVRAVGSLWLLLLVMFGTALLMRWILVSRRRLAVDQALRRREAMLAERGGESAPAAPSLQEVNDAAINVSEVEGQTARLVRVAALFTLLFGLWGIWADTLPALSVLDKVQIWPGEAAPVSAPASAASVGVPLIPSGAPADPVSDGGAETPPGPSSGGAADTLQELVQPNTGGVSLGDLLFAVVLLALTFVAARNIPGLLELTVLRRLNLQPGGSFAFTTSVRYLIVVIGIVIAFGKIGITWSKVQWIAAAITLGIGFGLQEVFANFVAGLILLFERPFRIGDIVTVGDVSGKVSQIRMRATTIRQFNNRELVVPNKDFITGQLVNWTLTDSVLRLEIPVGIAYGSDTARAKELLLEVAEKNPNVLADPAPGIVFGAFGDSALQFELRAHVGSPDVLLETKNQLHYAIDDAFRGAGIEIAFPQTDIHVRSMPEANDAKQEKDS